MWPGYCADAGMLSPGVETVKELGLSTELRSITKIINYDENLVELLLTFGFHVLDQSCLSLYDFLQGIWIIMVIVELLLLSLMQIQGVLNIVPHRVPNRVMVHTRAEDKNPRKTSVIQVHDHLLEQYSLA